MIDPKPKSVNKITLFKGKPNKPTGTIVAATSAGIDYTPKNVESRKARTKSGFIGSETEGVKVDQSGNTTAKPFTRKVIVSPGGYTKIVGDDGKVIKEGAGYTKEMQNAVKESEKKADITNSQREAHARANNLIGGSATNITRKEINSLSADKQATGDPMGNINDPKVLKARDKEKELHQLTEDRVKARNALKVKIKKQA